MTNTTSFVWDECFITGIDVVDDQHHQLVNLINEFGALMMRPVAADKQDIESLFSGLARYARKHFAEEEQLMTEKEIDLRHVEHHVQSHDQFTEDLLIFYENITEHRSEDAHELLKYLINWLVYHILGTDMLMTRLISAKKDGMTQEAAYQEYKTAKDPVTSKLLESMDSLFKQVSERNRSLAELNQTLEERVESRTKALLDANKNLEAMAMTDVLTSLPNRRYAMKLIESEWQKSVRYDTTLTFMMVDIDGLKEINDKHGHEAGDLALKDAAKILSDSVRAYDAVCRIGGDEFLSVCVQTSIDTGKLLAERIRENVANLVCKFPDKGEWSGSVSIGVAARTNAEQNASDLLRVADEYAYKAKINGKNRVEFA